MQTNLIKTKIIPFFHRFVANLEFTRRLPKEFGFQPIISSPRVNLRYLYTSHESLYQELLKVAYQYVEPGQNVWDIGANIGVFTFASAYRVGHSGRVLAVDADDRHTCLLRKSSLRSLPQSAPVDVLNAAIADKVKITELNVVETGHAKNYIVETSGCGETGKVISRKHTVSVTLDWLLAYFPKPDFIKIDVEGAELMVLQGATEMLQKIRPIFYLETQEYNKIEVTKLLKDFDYNLYTVAGDASDLVEIEQCGFNTLACPKETYDKLKLQQPGIAVN
jgi:FkbM family methyltransferase